MSMKHAPRYHAAAAKKRRQLEKAKKDERRALREKLAAADQKPAHA